MKEEIKPAKIDDKFGKPVIKELTTDQKMQQLMQKISNVVEQSKPVKKSGENDFHHYKYATHADIIQELRALIVKNKLSIIPSVTERTKEGEFTTVKMEFTITDLETGHTIYRTFFGDGQDKGDKGLYKAYTGALKYFLLDTFMIETGDDPEKTSPEAKPVAKQTYTPPAMVENQRVKILALIKEKGKTIEDLNKFTMAAFKLQFGNLNTAQANAAIKKLESMPTPNIAEVKSDDLDLDEIDKGIQEQQLKKDNGAVGTTTEPK